MWVLGFALSVGACAKAQAKVATDGPPLAVPEPPSRVIVPPDEPLASAPPPETPPAPAPRAAARSAPAPRRANAASAAPEPETKTETPAPTPPITAQPTPPPTEPPRELRPALSAADPAEEKKVRDVLQRAARDLRRVNYQKLTSEGRAQYDQSKRFSDQADQAIKERNYVYAGTLADKAAALAAELPGR